MESHVNGGEDDSEVYKTEDINEVLVDVEGIKEDLEANDAGIPAMNTKLVMNKNNENEEQVFGSIVFCTKKWF